MPKESSKKTSQKRSPAKRKEPKQPPPPPSTDESTWRQSRVPRNETICATDIIKLYRLHSDDIKELDFDEQPSGPIKPTKVYKEHEVERVAWKKHGSPEGFEARLDKLEEQWKARPGNTSPFPRPRWSGSGSVSIVSPGLPDPEKSWEANARLRDIKTLLPLWIWRACNRALDKTEQLQGDVDYGPAPRVPNWQREDALGGARKLAREYPARPSVPHESTPAVDKVREVLSRAPKDENDRDMVKWENHQTGNTGCHWSERYEAQLFAALIDVIKAHGVEGWKSLRWEVYDTYRECLVDLEWNRRKSRWEDDGVDWLYGRLVHRPNTGSSRHCHCSDIGRQYNAMLPACHF